MGRVVRHKITDKKFLLSTLTAIIILLIFSACSTTTLSGVWRDQNYHGKRFKKLLVVGISSGNIYRRLVEDTFCRQFRAYGIAAFPSYSLFSLEELKDKKALAAKIKGMGFDSMLISEVTGKKTRQSIQPGHTYVTGGFGYYEPPSSRRAWNDYYRRAYEIIHEPPYIIQYEVVSIENNLYDVRTEKLVWGAVSDTIVEGKMKDLISSFTEVVIKDLIQTHLFH